MTRSDALALGLGLLLLGPAACGEAKRAALPAQRLQDAAGAPAPPAPAAQEKARSGDKQASAASDEQGPRQQPAGPATRKLIRSGRLTLEVARYDEAAREAARITESLGGYVAESQAQREQEGHQRGTLTLRLPAERFAEAVASLSRLGKLRAESLGTQDVTKAYFDLETRLRVKRETEARLREILRTRAAKLSDVLDAERELARVTEEIEQLEGERRFYDQQVALATLVVEMREPAAFASGALEPLGEAFGEALEVMASSAAGLIYLAAAGLPWLVALWLLYRLVRVLRRRRGATKA